MGVVKMLGVLVVISAIVLRAECALTITGLSSVTIDVGGTFADQTAAVTESVTGVTFTIMNQPASNKFAIAAPATGVLSTAASAVFDAPLEYALVIKAEVSGATPDSGTVSITVTVANTAPVFAPATYSAKFTENQAAGKVLTTVTATDPGVGPKVAIMYSLMSMTGTGMWDPTPKLMVESDGKIKVIKVL